MYARRQPPLCRKIHQLTVDILMLPKYHQDVRTTLTLDDDIAAKLGEVAKKAGRPFKQVVNETLRLGLNAKRTMKPRKPFTVRTRDTGLRPGFELDCVASLLEDLEGPPRR